MATASFFAELSADQRRITLDCDAVVGHWPARADLDLSAARLAELFARGGIDRGLVTHTRGVWYDEARGATECLSTAKEHGWLPCPATNLRDAVGIGERLAQWWDLGVRAIRLPGTTQQVSSTTPGYALTVAEAARLGMTMLVEGGFTAVQGAFRGRGAKVVFLDISYYETADFLIAAADEADFVASTRRLMGPDSLETITESVGSSHLAFGSGSPLQDLEPSVWRLRDARLDEADFTAVAGGTLAALLGEMS